MKFGRKALTLLIVLLIISTPLFSFAYEKTVWDFTSDPIGSVPVGFTAADLDGRVYDARIATHFPGGIAAAVAGSNTFRYVVMGSWFTPVGEANRWLITPAITLPDQEPVLRWQGLSVDPAYLEAYNVWLSTTGNQPSDFTVTVQSVAAEPGSITNHSAALDSYAGQTVYIAFQLVSNDKYVFMLDNIEIDSTALYADAGDDQTIDYGGSATLAVGAVYNGTAPYTYAWSDGAQTIGTEQSVTVSPDTTSIYTCTVTDSLGETASDSVIVNVDSFLITASAGEGGSISPDGVTRLAPGGSQTYTIAPESGYRIASVLVDGVEQGRIPSYTFSDVQNNHTIAASFTEKSSSDDEPVYAERGLADSGGVALSGSSIHRSSKLNVKSLELQSLPAALQQAVSEGQMLLGYDIRLTRGFRGAVDISFPVGAAYEGQIVTILHYVNGNVETYTAVVTGGTATVSVSSLSPFVVLASGVYAPASVVTDPPKTGDAAGFMGYAVIAAAVVMAAALGKRRKPTE